MCISVHQLCYVHADKEPLFQNINLIVNTGQRLALVGNNGTGKSTLLRIIEGNLKPSSGEVVCSSRPYYIPQHFGQFDNLTVAEALRVDDRIKALHAMMTGMWKNVVFPHLLPGIWSICNCPSRCVR